MKTCPRCNGEGHEMIEEDGRQVRLDCYHCSASGNVTDEAYQEDMVQALITAIAGRMTARDEAESGRHEDGEDWAFAAAESGCSLQEYRHGQLVKNEMRVAAWLTKLTTEDPGLVDGLVDLYVRPPL